MQPVIYPIEKKKLIAELTEEHFMRKTNKGVMKYIPSMLILLQT